MASDKLNSAIRMLQNGAQALFLSIRA